DGWDAPYLPLMAQRGPMMIGFDKSATGEDQPVMAVDVSHPRISRDTGEALFLEHGGNTPYLDRLAQVMELIHVGHGAANTFVQTLDTMELIAPCSLKIKLKDGSQNELAGFYMIDDERLAAMSAAELEPLQSQQLLLPAFMMVASMSQLQALIRRRESKLQG
ncbi:MAG: SapC family protein, partial [Halieaceae bacterium]|nr:SapC family protein [Halieaceae bacterium]